MGGVGCRRVFGVPGVKFETHTAAPQRIGDKEGVLKYKSTDTV